MLFPGLFAMVDALLMASQNMNDAGSFGGPWLFSRGLAKPFFCADD